MRRDKGSTSCAIAAARVKAKVAKVALRLIVGDVTRLRELGVGGGFSLVFDLGCLHSIPDSRRDAYAKGVTEVAASGSTFLVLGLLPQPQFDTRPFEPR